MNIRRAHFERIRDDLIYETNQRCVSIHRQRIAARRNIRRRRARNLHYALRDILDHAIQCRIPAPAIILRQRRFNVRLRRHLHHDV